MSTGKEMVPEEKRRTKLNRSIYIRAIKNHPFSNCILESLDEGENEGTVTYSPDAVWVDPKAPDFSGYTTALNDEELVRILFLSILVGEYRYKPSSRLIELERVYAAPGRPKRGMKGSRADVIIRSDDGNAFMYIELKTPHDYVMQRRLIEGQLFQSSKLEEKLPRYLVWATVGEKNGDLGIECMVIPTKEWASYCQWHEAGEPCGNVIPIEYGKTIRRFYANVDKEGAGKMPLDHTCNGAFFSTLVNDLHDVLWGGGGTSSNEVFAILAKLLLCKAYDEKETAKEADYEFQVQYQNEREMPPTQLVERMNELYSKAAASYLGIGKEGMAFDSERIKPSKISYAVRRLEGVSITRNDYDGDLLGKFFEEIVAHGFTQTRGQFFTPQKLVDFMLDIAKVDEQAKDVIRNNPDGLGVRRFPYVIDPSCGVGTFLNSYMRRVEQTLDNEEFRSSLTERELEAVDAGFAGRTHSSWAKSSLYGVECNHDLGLAAKVNMILHGDGSMNTFVKSGLLPFAEYQVEGRPQNVLALRQEGQKKINGKFDLVLSNPPFSVKLTDDDKAEISNAFSGELGQSEDLFIERWHQLLRPGGLFCCILPESVFDTKKEESTRVWIMSRFRVKAIISLPYSAFQPYTSVKTCVVLAEKREEREARAILKAIAAGGTLMEATRRAFSECNVLDEPVFFAEPENVGYKRRKGLADLERPNDLPAVASRFKNGFEEDDAALGFFCTLGDVLSRAGFRLDPKYRWLWDKQHGEVHVSNLGDADKPLSTWLSKADVHELPKGPLEEPRILVDLDAVDGRMGHIDSTRVQRVESIGSSKISFEGCDLLFSKLESYLGKVVIEPPSDFIGTTEWVGLKCTPHSRVRELGYFLMLPELLEAYRRLQSGKRHARLNIDEMLELKVDADPLAIAPKTLEGIENKVEDLSRKAAIMRENIDSLYRGTH